MFWSVIILIAVLVVTYFLLNWILSKLKISNFHDKSIFITGCDSGFGRSMAMRLDNLGFNVFAGCLTKDGCTYLSERASKKLFPFIIDVTKSESIERALQIVKEKLPSEKGLWALVNNAGVAGMMGPVELCTMDDYQKVLNVNLFGLIEVTRQFLPLIRKAHGRIVNMSSMAGRIALAGGPYCCSKYGVEAFSDILRQEVYSQHIRVSIIEPGGFQTSLVNVDTLVEDVKRAYDRASPVVQSVYGNDYVNSCLFHVEAIRNINLRLGKNWNKDETNKHMCGQKVLSIKSIMAEVKSICSPDINPVLDDITHALTSRFPYARYTPGNDAKYFYIPLSYMPDWVVDWIMRKLNVRRLQVEKKKSN